MGSYQTLPSGKIRMREYVGTVDGKKIYKSFTGKTKKDCNSQYKTWVAAGGLASIAKGENHNEKHSQFTVKEVLDAYIEDCRNREISPATIKNYASIRDSANPDFMAIIASELSIDDLQSFVNGMNETLQPSSVRTQYGLVRAALRWNKINLPFDQIKLKPIKKKKLKEFDESDAQDAMDYFRDSDPEMYAYISLTSGASLRPAESMALTWGDISKKPIVIDGVSLGTISVNKATVRGEGGKYITKAPKSEAGERIVTVPWEMIEDLEMVLTRKADDKNLLDGNACAASHRWGFHRKKLGMADMRLYDFRHYFVTNAINAGATDEELAAMTGHSDPMFTHRYYADLMKQHRSSVNAKLASSIAARYKKDDTTDDTTP